MKYYLSNCGLTEACLSPRKKDYAYNKMDETNFQNYLIIYPENVNKYTGNIHLTPSKTYQVQIIKKDLKYNKNFKTYSEASLDLHLINIKL